MAKHIADVGSAASGRRFPAHSTREIGNERTGRRVNNRGCWHVLSGVEPGGALTSPQVHGVEAVGEILSFQVASRQPMFGWTNRTLVPTMKTRPSKRMNGRCGGRMVARSAEGCRSDS